jgi:hypothetical protein
MKFLKDRFSSERAQMIVLRNILLSYDTAKNDKERTELLEELKKYCYWSHDYQKPSNLKKIKKNVEEVKGADGDTSEEEDEELR